MYTVVHACNSKWPAAHVSSPLNFLRLLTSRLPDSLFLSEPSVRKMSCGVPSSGRAKRHLFSTSTVTDDTESRKQLQCSAKARKCHESPSRELQNEGEKNFPRFARTDRRFAPLFTPFGSAVALPLLNSSRRRCTRLILHSVLVTKMGQAPTESYTKLYTECMKHTQARSHDSELRIVM